MSTERTLYATQSAITKEDEPTTNFSSGTTEPLWARGDAYAHDMYVSFTPPEDMQYNNIDLMRAYVYIVPDGSAGLEISELDGGFDEDTITYQNAPYASSLTQFTERVTSAQYVSCLVQDAASAILHGLQVSPRGFCSADTSRGSNKPYLLVSFSEEDSTLEIQSASPSGGYTPKNTPVTFSWTTRKDGNCFGDLTQASAVFRYRENEESASTEVQLATETSYTLQSGISTSSFQWQVEITDNNGGVTTSSWYTLSTADAEAVATAVSPKNTILDATSPITFTWNHSTTTGSAQTKADLQYSTNNSAWTDFATVQGAANTYTASAGTIPGGTVWWRVRTYNADGIAGEWSAALMNDVVGAPDAPVVSANTSPRLTVTWQASGQQSYQVQVGDYDSGVRYGTDKSFTLPDYLDDGQYAVRVRVQNSYGLFSNWGNYTATVENVPGADITLTVQKGAAPMLSWSSSEYDSYRIYRDGVYIAQSAGNSFTDRFAPAGDHTYEVRGIYADTGNYGLSNAVAATVEIPNIMLYDVENAQWLHVPMTLKGSPASLSVERDVEFTHYSGAMRPTADIGEAIDRVYSFSPVFLYAAEQDAKKFEAMMGKLVYVKDPFGLGMFGVLSGYSTQATKYRRDYSAQIREVDVLEEEING